MTREEFLSCFSLCEPVPFAGRGPHRARDQGAGESGLVLVHLLEASSPGESVLAALVMARVGSGPVRCFELEGAVAVVTPDEPACASIEDWLNAESDPSSPAGPQVTEAKNGEPATVSNEGFSIRFRPHRKPPQPSSPAQSPAAAAPGPFTEAFSPVPSADEAVPRASLPPGAAPLKKEAPGEFTQLFGGVATPSDVPPVSLPNPSPDVTTPPPLAVTPAPEPRPGRPEPEDSPGTFTQLFGGLPSPTQSNELATPLSAVPLGTPRFDRDRGPEVPPSPTPAVPVPAEPDPGEFTRFFGGLKPKVGEPPETPSPAQPPPPRIIPPPPPTGASLSSADPAASYVDRLQGPPPLPPTPRPEAAPPRLPTSGPGAFTQVVLGLPAPGDPKPASPAAPQPPAQPASPDLTAPAEPERKLLPLVLVLSLAAVAVLTLILVFLLLR